MDGDAEGKAGRPADEPGTPYPDGVMLRPEARVLPDEALVPAAEVVSPPPDRFTHELVTDEPYRREGDSDPEGVLRAGTRVVVRAEGAARCRVVDGGGISIEVKRSSVRRLPRSG